MKKALISFLVSLSFPTTVFAQIGLSKDKKPGNIPVDISLGALIANTLQIMVIVGGLAALVFLVWGALDWILAGGDKEKLAGARKKIINTIVGLALLALSGFIVGLLGAILGIDIFNLKELPALFQVPGYAPSPPRTIPCGPGEGC